MSSPLRLRSALAWAVVGHLVLVVALRAVPTPSMTSSVAAPPSELALDETPFEPAPSLEATIEAREGVAATATPSVSAARTRETRPTTPSQAEATAGIPAPPSDPSWAFDPVRRSANDIGIGSHWKSVVAGGAGPGPAHEGNAASPADTARDEAQVTARAIDRSMRDMLAERDVGLGLGRAGPLVTAAREAASSPEAPEVGVTILEVDSDASGNVIAARAGDRAWHEIAAAVVRRMDGKPLRVRPGGRGLRARLRVVAERTLPAGAGGSTGLGAVPDDVPGGGTKVCEGRGVTRRCVAGMPVGVTSSGGDASNIGAKPIRVVHVQLVSETEL